MKDLDTMGHGVGYLGIDVGSTTIKAVLLDDRCRHVAPPIYSRSLGNPRNALHAALVSLREFFPGRVRMGITGSGRETVQRLLARPPSECLTEITAHALGARHERPDARWVIDIGGQDSKIIQLKPDDQGALHIEDFLMNELCAAGTGAFLEMHARELGYPNIEAFAAAAFGARQSVRIASRCSVLAQSDVVHHRQRGVEPDQLAAGLCRAVVRNVLSMLGGRQPAPPVLFQGGVASNAGVVKAFRETMGFSEQDLVVPARHRTMGALGAALHARECLTDPFPPEDAIRKLSQTQENPRHWTVFLPRLLPPVGDGSENHVEPSFAASESPFAASESSFPVSRKEHGTDLVLGIDVGAASTKVVGIDPRGNMVFTRYALHHGKPYETLKSILENHGGAFDLRRVVGVAATGSGREHVEATLAADFTLDEITAHALGAHILEPGASFLFEIGGEDSKYIHVREGNVLDFEMNRICAAGTGAFLMEAAMVLGIAPGAAMDALCFQSRRPLSISQRCCVFAKSDITSLLNRGFPKSDIAAGAVYSIAKNYLEIVVGNRRVGNSVLFLGGVARSSRAPAAAMERLRPGIRVSVPRLGAVAGALGAAHFCLNRLKNRDISRSRFHDFRRGVRARKTESFHCGGCTNDCRIDQWTLPDGSRRTGGGICGKHEQVQKREGGRDFVHDFLRLLDAHCRPRIETAPRTVGIPRALLFYEHGPAWVRYLEGLGRKVRLSRGGHEVIGKGARFLTSQSVCLPVKVMVGHVVQLIEDGISHIFFPTVVEMERVKGASRSDACPIIQGVVDCFLRPAFPDVEFISPVFTVGPSGPRWLDRLVETGKKLGVSSRQAEGAARAAEEALSAFQREKSVLSREFHEAAHAGRRCVVLLGRSYACARELSSNIPQQMAAMGIHVAPTTLFTHQDDFCLEERHFDLIFNSSQHIFLAARGITRMPPNVFGVMLNQFLCRADSVIAPFVDGILGNRPHLQMCLDENTSPMGFRTRMAAFSHVMDSTLDAVEHGASPPQPPYRGEDAFYSFVPDPGYRKFRGTVWMTGLADWFVLPAYRSIGLNARFIPGDSEDIIEGGRKFYSRAEPCFPFLYEAGAMEALMRHPDFDPSRDAVHMEGARHCAAASLPITITQVLKQLGLDHVPVICPREGLDVSEPTRAFGHVFARNSTLALFAREYFKKLLFSVRPYEAVKGDGDRVLEAFEQWLYSGFDGGKHFFRHLARWIEQMAGVRQVSRNHRPKILVTGEYIARTVSSLNNDIHRKIEDLGGKALYVPLYLDYTEWLAAFRPGYFFRNKPLLSALHEAVSMGFCRLDIGKIKSLFRTHIPERIDPDIQDALHRSASHLCSELDPCPRLEFYQAYWVMEAKEADGIVCVAPFGCNVSTAIAPLIHRLYQSRVPVLSLWLDGKPNIHADNRLTAFMENVHRNR